MNQERERSHSTPSSPVNRPEDLPEDRLPVSQTHRGSLTPVDRYYLTKFRRSSIPNVTYKTPADYREAPSPPTLVSSNNPSPSGNIVTAALEAFRVKRNSVSVAPAPAQPAAEPAAAEPVCSPLSSQKQSRVDYPPLPPTLLSTPPPVIPLHALDNNANFLR